MEISVPKLEYKVVAQPTLETQFVGNVTAIPTVFIHYLNQAELRTVAVILQETVEAGACALTMKQISVRLGMDLKRFYNEMHHLRRMGVIIEHREEHSVIRAINFKAAQHLDDLLAEEDRGIYRRLRKKLRYKNISNITRDDLQKAYNKYVLPPNHDIEEEEEYD